MPTHCPGGSQNREGRGRVSKLTCQPRRAPREQPGRHLGRGAGPLGPWGRRGQGRRGDGGEKARREGTTPSPRGLHTDQRSHARSQAPHHLLSQQQTPWLAVNPEGNRGSRSLWTGRSQPRSRASGPAGHGVAAWHGAQATAGPSPSTASWLVRPRSTAGLSGSRPLFGRMFNGLREKLTFSRYVTKQIKCLTSVAGLHSCLRVPVDTHTGGECAGTGERQPRTPPVVPR